MCSMFVVYVIQINVFIIYRWYHFNISRHVAESLLISTGEDGSYLLRDSGANPGEFSLSVRYVQVYVCVCMSYYKWNS